MQNRFRCPARPRRLDLRFPLARHGRHKPPRSDPAALYTFSFAAGLEPTPPDPPSPPGPCNGTTPGLAAFRTGSSASRCLLSAPVWSRKLSYIPRPLQSPSRVGICDDALGCSTSALHRCCPACVRRNPIPARIVLSVFCSIPALPAPLDKALLNCGSSAPASRVRPAPANPHDPSPHPTTRTCDLHTCISRLPRRVAATKSALLLPVSETPLPFSESRLRRTYLSWAAS